MTVATAPIGTGAGAKAPTLSLASGLAPALLALALVVLALLTRPLLPVDETRYLTVAWEMRQSGNWLVPHLNGELYSHKPPVLFWLINLIWTITGPSEFAARLAPATFLPISVWLTNLLGQKIGGRQLGHTAGFVAVSLVVFTVLGSMAMFDAMLTAAAATALIGFVDAAQGKFWRGFALAGVAMGVGVLIKGPAILLHTLPAALAAPLWAPRQRWARWYAMLAGAVVLAAAIALAWALSAAQAAGPEFGRTLIWGQTAGRVASADADHASPFWLYFAFLPLMLAPWVLSRTLWSLAFKRAPKAEIDDQARLMRMPLIAAAGSFVLFTFISAKQPHYLMPAAPSAAVLLAALILKPHVARKPEPLFAGALAFVGAILLAFALAPKLAPKGYDFSHIWPGVVLIFAGAIAYLLRRKLLTVAVFSSMAIFATMYVASLEGAVKAQSLDWVGERLQRAAGAPLAWAARYHGEVGFKGRLTVAVQELARDGGAAWLADHPDGILMAPFKMLPPGLPAPDEVRPYRGGKMGLWYGPARKAAAP